MGKLPEHTLLAPGSCGLDPFHHPLGKDASSDVLRHCTKCSRCGRKGASLTAPSWESLDIGFALFPAERMSDFA